MKKHNMRYTVRVYANEISNVINTDDISEAISVENYYAGQYGRENVWICDNLQEIMVG